MSPISFNGYTWKRERYHIGSLYLHITRSALTASNERPELVLEDVEEILPLICYIQSGFLLWFEAHKDI